MKIEIEIEIEIAIEIEINGRCHGPKSRFHVIGRSEDFCFHPCRVICHNGLKNFLGFHLNLFKAKIVFCSFIWRHRLEGKKNSF